ncbi:hypothetical protein EMCRGX_G032126 [Ephydatia muelleri]
MQIVTSRILQSLRRPFQQVATYYVKPKETKGPSMQAWLALLGISTSIAGGVIYLLGKPDEAIGGLDELPDQYADVNVVKAYLLRARDQLMEYKKSFTEPSSKSLLPDPLPAPYQRSYTLILEVNDVLMHRNYERGYGWKYQKRPGVDALLVKLFDLYEIVTFTSENAFVGHPIITSLDPNGELCIAFWRPRFGDITHINRPLNKVIIIDTDPKAVETHPDNSIVLPKWTGDIHDKTLFDLVPLLQAIASNEVDDIRPVLNHYKSEGGNVVEVFKAHQAKLLEEEMRRREEQKRLLESQHKIGGTIVPFSLGSFIHKKHLPSVPQDQVTTDSQEAAGWSLGRWLGWK